ncbi:MAG: hypothetical protein AAFX93_14045 [Verrucomicrobiota bacterium]
MNKLSNLSPYYQATLDDPIVRSGRKAGASNESIIGAMYQRHQAMKKRLMDLEMIAPRRIKVGDSEMIYRVPEQFIPVDDYNLKQKNQ